MSAELLRRAAEELRDHIGKRTYSKSWCPDYVWAAVRHLREDCEHEVQCGVHDSCEGGHPGMLLGRYIALMHPPVALALADWLERYAEWQANDWTDAPHALAVARAILREDT